MAGNERDSRSALPVAVALLGALGACTEANALTVSPSSALLDEESITVYSSQTNTYYFSTPGAGTLDVSLTNIPFPALLSSLTATLSAPGETIGSLLPGPNAYFQVGGALNLSAYVTAQAQGALDEGMYSLTVTFIPAGAPVPLPASGLLLLSGVLLAAGAGWRARVPARNQNVICAA